MPAWRRAAPVRWLERGLAPFLGLVTLGSAPLASGQTSAPPSPVTPLDQVTVTATRVEREAFEVPYSAYVLGQEELLRLPVRTLPDALQEIPGIMVQKTSYGQASPFLRGFTGFRTLMLIDGIRLNNAVFRDGPNQYWGTTDLLSVDRLETVKGPSSVLYGSDAIGGTVNLLTANPLSLREPGRSAGGRPAWQSLGYYRYASAEESHVLRGQVSVQADARLGLSAGLTSKRFADLQGGEATGLQPGTGYRERDRDFKVQFRPRHDLELTAAYFRVRQDDVPRTHATIQGKSFSGTALGTDLVRSLDQARDLAYVQAMFRQPVPGIARASASVSWQRQAEEQDRVRPNLRREITGLVDDQWGWLMAFESPSRLGTFCYGLEYYRDEVDSYGTDTPAGGVTRILPRGPVADDAGYRLLGVYLQDQIQIGPRLELIPGVRYSRARATARQVDPEPADAVVFGPLDRTSAAFTTSLRARFAVGRHWNLFGGVSEGFRAPNLSDYTSFELARSGERETPAPGLNPEKYVSYEVGAKARIPALRLEFQGALFHTDVRNQVTRFPTGRMIGTEREVTKANTGDGFVRGIELSVAMQLEHGFSLRADAAWTEGEVDTYVSQTIERQPASRMQPLTFHFGPRWRARDGRFWAEGLAAVVQRQDRLSPGDVTDTQRIPPGGTPGYSVCSLRGGWRLNSHLTICLALENLRDVDYRVHGSGVNEPGFNAVGTVLVRF
jgi:hemoglobin/transferrin/lactoferrin receptor protein